MDESTPQTRHTEEPDRRYTFSDPPTSVHTAAWQIASFRQSNKKNSQYKGIDQYLDDFLHKALRIPAVVRQAPPEWLTTGIGGPSGVIAAFVLDSSQYLRINRSIPLLEQPSGSTLLGRLEGVTPTPVPDTQTRPQQQRKTRAHSRQRSQMSGNPPGAFPGGGRLDPPPVNESTPDNSRRQSAAPTEEVHRNQSLQGEPAPGENPIPQAQPDFAQMGAMFAQFMAAMNAANGANAERPGATLIPDTSSSNGRGFREQEIGYFQPNLPESFGKGEVVYTGHDTYIRDVFVFIDRIKDVVASRSEDTVKARIPACLRGDALEWYTSGLQPIEKDALRYTPGLDRWEEMLIKEFRPPFQEVMDNLTKAKFTLEDAKARRPGGPYVYGILRNAKATGMLDTFTQLNWAYNNIHPLLQDGLARPTAATSVTTFIQGMNEKRETWQALAALYLNAGLGNARRPNSKYPFQSERRMNSQPNGYRPNRGFDSSRFSINDRRPAYQPQSSVTVKALPPPKPMLAIANGTPTDTRSRRFNQGREFAGRGNHNNGNGRPMRPFQSNNAEDCLNEDDNSEDIFAHSGYDQSKEGNDEDDYNDPNEDEDDGVVTAHFVKVQNQSNNAHLCRKCKASFPSGNLMHKHIQECLKRNRKPTVRAITFADDILEPSVVSSNVEPSGTGMDFRAWTYVTCTAAAAEGGQPLTVSPDSGSTMSLIDRQFLDMNFPHAQRRIMPERVGICGVANGSVEAPEFAVIDLYLPGTRQVNGKTISSVAHLKIEAHVLDKLNAGLLIGVDCLKPNGILIDPANDRIQIKSCKDLVVPASFIAKPNARDRRVKASTKTTIPAFTVTPVAIDMHNSDGLPTDRDYLFEPAAQGLKLGPDGGIYAHITTANTSAVYVSNASAEPLTIEKGTNLGRLTRLEVDGGYQLADESHSLAGERAPFWKTSNPNILLGASYDDSRQQLLKEELPTHGHANVPAYTVEEDLDRSTLRQVADKEWVGAFGVRIFGNIATAKEVNELVLNFEPLFTDDGKPAKVDVDDWMRIPLVGDWKAVGAKLAHRIYPLGPKEREIVDNTFDKLHGAGKLGWSKGGTPFAFPVFVVWRNVMINGEIVRKGRAVVDIRGLNKIATKDSYPVPDQEQILARVRGMRFLSVIDMAAYFHQFRIAAADRHKTTTVSHRGLEEWSVAPMGYAGSPPYAQRQTDKIIREGKCQSFAAGYVDDVICHSGNLGQHLDHLAQLFNALMTKDLTLSGPKAFLAYPSVNLLGQRVDAFGLYTSDEKLAAIRNLSFPKTLEELEIYLGLTGWLRKYIAYYCQLVEPLQQKKTESLKKAPTSGYARTHYTKTTQIPQDDEKLWIAYRAIQDAFKEPRWLVHFDMRRQLYISLDASKKRGFGVVIFHCKGDPTEPEDIKRGNVEPIMFLSKMLSPAERNYWPTELEVAAAVWSVRRSRHLIDSAPVNKPAIMLTDHAATTGIVKQTSLTTSAVDKLNMRLIRASEYLSQFRLIVKHVPGRTHTVPDALSRLENLYDNKTDLTTNVLDDLSVFHATEQGNRAYSATLIQLDKEFKEQLIRAYQTDKHWASVFTILEPFGPHTAQEEAPIPYILRQGLLYYVEPMDGSLRLVVPKALQGDIFNLMHDQRMHCGFKRAYEAIRSSFHIKRLAKHLEEYIAHCRKCGPNQTRRHKPYGELRPIQSPPVPFHTISIDLVTGLPDDQGFDAAMSVTDKYSKRITVLPGKSTWGAKEWSKVLLDGLADWGVPAVIISDRDTRFTSELWKGIFKLLGTAILMSTAYHPETDGQSERTNQTFEIALRFMIAEGDHSWVTKLPTIRRLLNNSVNAATKLSPNEVIYGFKLSEGLPVERPFADTLFDREVNRKEASAALAHAAVQMKKNFDAKHTPLRLATGDQAYVRLHKGFNIPGTHRKLGQQYAGPFLVTKAVGGNAYELDLPHEWKIHPVISIAYLEPYRSNDPYDRREPEQPGAVEDERNDAVSAFYRVERLLNRRTTTVGRYRRPVIQYLVKWEDWGPEYNKWVNMDSIDPELTAAFDKTLPPKDPLPSNDQAPETTNSHDKARTPKPGRPPKRKDTAGRKKDSGLLDERLTERRTRRSARLNV